MRHPVITEDLEAIVSRGLPWETFSGRTVLITGAYGFINAYLVETLLYLNETREGFNVRVLALGRNRKKAEKRFAHYLDRDDLVFLLQDVCEPLKVESSVDFVIHGASWASPKYYGKYPAEVLAPNVFGTHQLLELARHKKSRGFLFLSSAENYGALSPEHIPIRETEFGRVDPLDVRSCYAESKRMGETLCAAWFHQHDVPFVSARIFHTYGPGMALDDGRVFADFVADVVAGRSIRMKSDGSALRAYCYLVDATEALFRMLLLGVPGQAYNMGNPDAECSVLELAETVVGLFPDEGLEVVRAAEQGDGYLKSRVSRTIPDTAKLSALGWTPRYGVTEGFRRTILSYR